MMKFKELDKNGLPVIRKKTKEERQMQEYLAECLTRKQIIDEFGIPLNNSMNLIIANISGLVTLLLDKGIITHEELEESIELALQEMEQAISEQIALQ